MWTVYLIFDRSPILVDLAAVNGEDFYFELSVKECVLEITVTSVQFKLTAGHDCNQDLEKSVIKQAKQQILCVCVEGGAFMCQVIFKLLKIS